MQTLGWRNDTGVGRLVSMLTNSAATCERRDTYAIQSASTSGLQAGSADGLQRKKVSLADVGELHVVQFLRGSKRRTLTRNRERDALHCLSAWLRSRSLIKPRPCTEPTPLDLLLGSFATYLSVDRSLEDSTVRNYCPSVRLFLSERFGSDRLDTQRLSGKDVYDFVARHAYDHCAKRTQVMLSALRSFLRFCHLRGHIASALAENVPSVTSWRQKNIPSYLTADEVERVLAACDQSTAVGRRDYAILMLLARLALRAGEIVALTLDDLLWESGEISVFGKGKQRRRMPLTEDVGRAVSSYLTAARPRVESRSLFIRVRAPLRGFGSVCAISTIVEEAIKRAGLNPPAKGAQLLRRSLATGMLRQGATLSEIGQILRHKNPATTAIYTKVDFDALRQIALPWPGRYL